MFFRIKNWIEKNIIALFCIEFLLFFTIYVFYFLFGLMGYSHLMNILLVTGLVILFSLAATFVYHLILENEKAEILAAQRKREFHREAKRL